jgi:hypothetical protein
VSNRKLGCCCAALLPGIASKKRRCSPAVSGSTPRCPCLIAARPAGPRPAGRRRLREQSGGRTGCGVVSGLRVGAVQAPPVWRAGWGPLAAAAAWPGACTRPHRRQRVRIWLEVRRRERGQELGAARVALRPAPCAARWVRSGVGAGCGVRRPRSGPPAAPSPSSARQATRGCTVPSRWCRARWCDAPSPPVPGAASAPISRGPLGVAASCGQGGAGVGGGGQSAGGQGIRVRPQHPNTALEATGHTTGFFPVRVSVRCGPRLSLGVRLHNRSCGMGTTDPGKRLAQGRCRS